MFKIHVLNSRNLPWNPLGEGQEVTTTNLPVFSFETTKTLFAFFPFLPNLFVLVWIISLFCSICCYACVSSLFCSLHWLPFSPPIFYLTSSLNITCLPSLASTYLFFLSRLPSLLFWYLLKTTICYSFAQPLFSSYHQNWLPPWKVNC